MREELVDAVLQVAALVPAGKVLSYGDIAELLGAAGPRQVGRVMALHGGAVSWWRVVRSDGSLPAVLMWQALEHYRHEGTGLLFPSAAARPALPKVRMAQARWVPAERDFARIDGIAADLRTKLSAATGGIDA
ncbi:MGMT family protein [Arthrobacter mobilis]|uniref:DNA-binding protein n=1 Tax=Arthrobacter mobilis TaxID=2724944 RepID=A0A7X6HCM8_9MICC|nr:MGMT family protein [Arthrobacter mobilis]NKX53789.1 DNA-binding protein [Arthrobacter mobilis]